MRSRKDKLAYYAALSAFIGIFENFIPMPIPFLRLGLANIPVTLGLATFRFRELIYIVLFKLIMTHLFRGTLFSYPFLIALAGNALFICGIFPLSFLLKKEKISFVTVSFAGACLHNSGQLLVAALFLSPQAVFYYSIILLTIGALAGFINGVFCNIIYNKIVLRFFMDDKLYIVRDDYVQCTLCPNMCKLKKDGQIGSCRIRKREGHTVVNPFSGVLSSESIDPIEKKPLFHFMPKSTIFSVGFFGCTMHCRFCQNYHISQQAPPGGHRERVEPAELVAFLQRKGLESIAFTYSEPTLYYEWVLESSKLCREAGIKTVLVTNGYLNPGPARELLSYTDAANIDLKAFNEEFYKNLCNAKLEPVKEFIEIAYSLGVHIELTTLIITDSNDSLKENAELVDFIADLSPDIPYHISRYSPAYKMTLPSTSQERMMELMNSAKKKLNYVYCGNVGFGGDSYCKKCGELLVQRTYYNVKVAALDEKGQCSKCGEYNYFRL